MNFSFGIFQIFDKIVSMVRLKIDSIDIINFEFKIHNIQRFFGIAITALGFILSVTISIKTDSLVIILAGLAWVVGYPLLFWSNLKIIKELHLLPLRFKNNISNLSYLDISIVYYLFASVFIAASSLYFALFLSSLKIAVFGVIFSFLILYLISYISRHEFIGLIEEKSAAVWEDGLSFISIPVRLFCRLGGLTFAISNIFLVLALLYTTYLAMSDPQAIGIDQLYTGLALFGAGSALIYAGSPLLVYLIALPIFLVFRLLARIAGDESANQSEDLDLRIIEVHIHGVTEGDGTVMILNGEHVLNLYRSGTMAPDTLVWTEGLDEWLPVSKLHF